MAEAALQDEEVLDAQEENEEQQAPEEQAPETPEDRARKLGWRPKEEFKGDPAKWVEAASFLKQAEDDYPRLKQVNHHLVNKVDKLEKGIEQILAHQQRELSTASEQAYKRALEDIQRQHAQAVEDGDTQRAAKLFTQGQTLAQQKVQESKSEPTQADINAAVAAWREENPWFDEHPHMAIEAERKELMLAQKGVPLQDRLKQTADYIKSRYASELGIKPKERDPAPANVQGANKNRVVRPTVKPNSYEALTAQARAECDRTVRTSNGKISREDWLRYAQPEMFVK
jgi:hypothetical protein